MLKSVPPWTNAHSPRLRCRSKPSATARQGFRRLERGDTAIEQARADIASRITSLSLDVVKDADRVIDQLRQADECLRDVVKDIEDRSIRQRP